MKLKRVAIGIVAALLASALANAQVAADPVAAPGIPAGNIFAPHTPAGMVIIGANVWVGDEAQGLRHYIPVAPNNVDPVNTGQMMFDTSPEWSIGGARRASPGARWARWRRMVVPAPMSRPTITRKGNRGRSGGPACGWCNFRVRSGISARLQD